MAYLGSASLTWGWSALRNRELELHEIELDGLRLDLPLLQSLLPAAGPDTTGSARGPAAFPAPGSIAGLPGVAIGRLELSDVRVRTDSTTTITAQRLGLHAELRRGRTPALDLDWLAVGDHPARFATPQGRLALDPIARRAGGELELRLPDAGDFELSYEPAGRDSTRLMLDGRLASGQALDLDLLLEVGPMRGTPCCACAARRRGTGSTTCSWRSPHRPATGGCGRARCEPWPWGWAPNSR